MYFLKGQQATSNRINDNGISPMSAILKSIAKPIFWKLLPFVPKPVLKKYKEYSEFRFWADRYTVAQKLDNDHYEYFYTKFFDLDRSWYRDKKILDIGCGPRGSLEWADVAEERVGLDPLIDRYRSLGIDRHKMTYCHAPVERIPFSDGAFNVVATFNSLDHVENVETAIAESNRVLAPGGTLLLIVEVNHSARPTEPIVITENELKKQIAKLLSIRSWRAYPIRYDHDIYQSLREESPAASLPHGVPGIVAARFEKAAGT
jgi:ubiquinone/menaquinone biosynthesis C-methylase UbiE